MHLIWLALVLPTMFLIPWSAKPLSKPRIWSTLFGITALAITALVAGDLYSFLSSSGLPSDSFARALFTVLTMTDAPLIALAIGSVINWGYSRRG